jgi:hypothetical protein
MKCILFNKKVNIELKYVSKIEKKQHKQLKINYLCV